MLGKRIPNLLVVLDSEKGAEFRVQLEVKVKDADQAAELAKQLGSQSKKQLGLARNTIEGLVGGFQSVPPAIGPTLNFKRILQDSFDENSTEAPNP